MLRLSYGASLILACPAGRALGFAWGRRAVSTHLGHNPSREALMNSSPEALGQASACGTAITDACAGCRSRPVSSPQSVPHPASRRYADALTAALLPASAFASTFGISRLSQN